MKINGSYILGFRNSLVGPDTFVGDVLGYPIEGLLLGLYRFGDWFSDSVCFLSTIVFTSEVPRSV